MTEFEWPKEDEGSADLQSKLVKLDSLRFFSSAFFITRNLLLGLPPNLERAYMPSAFAAHLDRNERQKVFSILSLHKAEVNIDFLGGSSPEPLQPSRYSDMG
jgi:hypothetical protein